MGIYQGKLVGVSYTNAGPDGRPTAIDLTPAIRDLDLPIYCETVRHQYGGLSNLDRLDNYRRQTGGKLTPRQQRRAEQKARRATQKRTP